MHSRIGKGLMAIVAAGIFSLSAQAGHKSIQQVVISGSSAWGDLGYARNSSDSVQYIGCYIIGSHGVDGGAIGVCQARNAAGVTRSCSTENSAYLYIITSLNGDSSVEFRWNSDGDCTMLIVKNQSTLAPKQP